jgi:hypothetical protein
MNVVLMSGAAMPMPDQAALADLDLPVAVLNPTPVIPVIRPAAAAKYP